MNFIYLILSCLYLFGDPGYKDTKITFKVDGVELNSVTLSVKKQETQVSFHGGEGSVVLPLEVGQYATLSYGNKKRQLFLEPGSDLTVTIQPDDTFLFEGENADDSKAIENWEKLDAFVIANGRALWNKEKTWEQIRAENDKRPDLITCSDALHEMELLRIRCVQLDFLMVYSGMVYRDKLMKRDGAIQEFSSEVKEPFARIFGDKYSSPDQIDFSREVGELLPIGSQYLEVGVYERVLGRALAQILRFDRNLPINEAVLQRVNYGLEHWKDKYMNSYNLENVMEFYISNFGFNKTEELRTLYEQHVIDKNKIEKLKNMYEAWLRLTPGSECPNFSFLDVDGKSVDLASFKGKYVFIDVWATWCGPCKSEIPYLKQLEEKYANNNIHFLGISVDDPKMEDLWKKMIQDGETAGIPLRVCNGDFSRFFQILQVPRFILLDKEGKILNERMPSPSNPETVKILEALPGF